MFALTTPASVVFCSSSSDSGRLLLLLLLTLLEPALVSNPSVIPMTLCADRLTALEAGFAASTKAASLLCRSGLPIKNFVFLFDARRTLVATEFL